MLRILGPDFVAGLIVDGKRIVRAAPVIRYMIGWTVQQVAARCAQKGWECETF
jgi:hypothetical protein